MVCTASSRLCTSKAIVMCCSLWSIRAYFISTAIHYHIITHATLPN